MLVTWRYRERKSLIQSFDPRGLAHLLCLFHRCHAVLLGFPLSGRSGRGRPADRFHFQVDLARKPPGLALHWCFCAVLRLFHLSYRAGWSGSLYPRAPDPPPERAVYHFRLAAANRYHRRARFFRPEPDVARFQPGQYDHPDPLHPEPGLVWSSPFAAWVFRTRSPTPWI